MSKNIKEQIVKSIDLQNNNFVDKDNITQSFQPRNAYLLPKTDGTHERYVTDYNNVISKQAAGQHAPIMSDNYYGLWDDTNKKFIDGNLKKEGEYINSEMPLKIVDAYFVPQSPKSSMFIGTYPQNVTGGI